MGSNQASTVDIPKPIFVFFWGQNSFHREPCKNMLIIIVKNPFVRPTIWSFFRRIYLESLVDCLF